MSKFVIRNSANGKYHFNFVANNGQIILTSQSYTTKYACTRGIESVKNNAAIKANYDKQISANDKYYFNLVAGNGEIIGSSETYETKEGCDNGIEAVMKNAIDATIIEEEE